MITNSHITTSILTFSLVFSGLILATAPVYAQTPKPIQIAEDVPSEPISFYGIPMMSSPETVKAAMAKLKGPRVTLGHSSAHLLQYWNGAYSIYPAQRWDFEFQDHKLYQASVFIYCPEDKKDSLISTLQKQFTQNFELPNDFWSTIEQVEGIDSIMGINGYNIRIINIPGGPIRLIVEHGKTVEKLDAKTRT